MGPLLGQCNIRQQLYIRNYRFIWYTSRSNNTIVKNCFRNALYNSNTCIGYKLAFYRYKFDIDLSSNMKNSIARMSASELNCDQLAIVSNLTSLINVRSGNEVINDFTTKEVNYMINMFCRM